MRKALIISAALIALAGTEAAFAFYQIHVGAHYGLNGYSQNDERNGQNFWGGRIKCRLSDKMFLAVTVDHFWAYLAFKKDSIGPGIYQYRDDNQFNKIKETLWSVKIGRILWSSGGLNLNAAMDFGGNVSDVEYLARILPDSITPYDPDIYYGKTTAFFTIRPNMGLEYHVPKTNLNIGMELRFTHHLNYWKEDWKTYNNYPSASGYFTFDLLER